MQLINFIIFLLLIHPLFEFFVFIQYKNVFTVLKKHIHGNSYEHSRRLAYPP